MRLREQQQNQMIRPPQMMAGQMPGGMMRPRNGMPPNNLTKTVLQNNTSGLYAILVPFL